MTEEQKISLFIKTKANEDMYQDHWEEIRECENRAYELRNQVDLEQKFIEGLQSAIALLGIWKEYKEWKANRGDDDE